MLGYSFKPETKITTGSPAVLVLNILEEWLSTNFTKWDPYVDAHDLVWPGTTTPHVVIIGTRHPEFAQRVFPDGSIVIDPFRFLHDAPDHRWKVIRVGE